MPNRATFAALQLIGGGWCGLFVGLIEGHWSHSMLAAVVYGVAMACVGLYFPDCPADSISENWRELSGRERRMIARALSRGEVVPQRTLTTLTIRAGESIAAEPPSTTRFEAGRIALIAAVVVIATLLGAPPGWAVAGAAFPAAAVAYAVYSRSEPIRERARRAAELNRARLAAPEGVPAGVRGVSA